MSSQSTRGRVVSGNGPISLDDGSTSTRFHSSIGARDNDASYKTDNTTRHDLCESTESVFDSREKDSAGSGSLACLIGLVIALVTQILLACGCLCVLLFFDWQPHTPEDTALSLTIVELGIVGLIAIMFCDPTSMFFYVALIVLFVIVSVAEGALALGLYFVTNKSCVSFSCELLKADKLQRYVLLAMLASACCVHLIVLVAVIVAKIVDCRHKRAAENASNGLPSGALDSYKTTPDISATTPTVRSRSVYDDSNRTYAGGHLHCCSKASLALSSLPAAVDVESMNRKHEVAIIVPHVRIKIPPLSHSSAFGWHEPHADNSTGTALHGVYA